MNEELYILFKLRIEQLLKDKNHIREKALNGKRPSWLPSIERSPGYQISSLDAEEDDKSNPTKLRFLSKHWIIQRNNYCPESFTPLISDRGLNQGIHCWTFKVLEEGEMYLGFIFPTVGYIQQDEDLINTFVCDKNRNASGELLNKDCCYVYCSKGSNEEEKVSLTYNYIDERIGFHTCSNLIGKRVGFLLDFHSLQANLLLFNSSNLTNKPDEIILLKNLFPDRSYYPAMSMKAHEGVVELETSTSWEYAVPSYLNIIQSEVEIAEGFRQQNMILMETVDQLQRRIKDLEGLIEDITFTL